MKLKKLPSKYILRARRVKGGGSLIRLKSTSDRAVKKEVNEMIRNREFVKNQEIKIQRFDDSKYAVGQEWRTKFTRICYVDNRWVDVNPFFVETYVEDE